jgi:homoserine dehydrogenase
LLAHHGSDLLALASRQGQILAFEAAVAGAIPLSSVRMKARRPIGCIGW